MISKRKTKEFLRACLVPTALALLTYTFLFYLGNRFAVSNAAEEVRDAQMSFHANHVHLEPDERHYVFVDFNEQTLSNLGDPTLIPIPLVTATLEQLAHTRPWAIFIDLDLTYLQTGEQLDQLQRALLALQALNIPVFLERELLGKFPGHEAHFRQTPLAELVAQSPTIAWFSAASSPSSKGVERHIPYLVRGSIGLDGAVTEQVSSAALSALLLKDAGGDERLAKQILASALVNPRQACPQSGAPPGAICFATPFPLVLDKPQEYLHYTLRWNKLGALIQPVSAGEMLAGRNAALDIAHEAFKNDVVILGSSAADRGDLRQTSLGEMPGSLVILNMIRAWLVDGPEQAPSYLSGFLTVLLLALSLAAVNFLTLNNVPDNWHGYAGLALSTVLSLVIVLVYYLFNFTGGVGWLIALQYVNAILFRSPSEKPDPILAWLTRSGQWISNALGRRLA